MINKVMVKEMYVKGITLQEIGNKFGVSRQRIWQCIKKDYHLLDVHRRKIPNNDVVNPRPEELYIFKKLHRRGMNPKFKGYNDPYDILVGTKKVQIKFRSYPVFIGKNNYYKFNFLQEKEKPDFYIFMCGMINSKCYIVPGIRINANSLEIPPKPLRKNTKRFSKLYKENWGQILAKSRLSKHWLHDNSRHESIK